jgi:histidinol phosphatase-like enzyme
MCFCLRSKPKLYEYYLNDIKIKPEKIVVLNDTEITIDYGNKLETLNVKQDDSFRYKTNLIYTHKSKNDIYIDEYKSVGTTFTIKFTCSSDSLLIENYIKNNEECVMEGEEDKWNKLFNN